MHQLFFMPLGGRTFFLISTGRGSR